MSKQKSNIAPENNATEAPNQEVQEVQKATQDPTISPSSILDSVLKPVEIKPEDFELENREASGLLGDVIEREYSKQSPQYQEKAAEAIENSQPEPPKKAGVFGAFGKNRQIQEKPIEQVVPEMQTHDDEAEDFVVTSDNIGVKVSSGEMTASSFVVDGIADFGPELLHAISKIKENKILGNDKLDDDYKKSLINFAKERNKANRKQLEIPVGIVNNLRKGLSKFFIDKGIEHSLPAWMPLIVGVGLLIWWGTTTTMRIKNENEFYLNDFMREIGAIQNQRQREYEKMRETMAAMQAQLDSQGKGGAA